MTGNRNEHTGNVDDTGRRQETTIPAQSSWRKGWSYLRLLCSCLQTSDGSPNGNGESEQVEPSTTREQSYQKVDPIVHPNRAKEGKTDSQTGSSTEASSSFEDQKFQHRDYKDTQPINKSIQKINRENHITGGSSLSPLPQDSLTLVSTDSTKTSSSAPVEQSNNAQNPKESIEESLPKTSIQEKFNEITRLKAKISKDIKFLPNNEITELRLLFSEMFKIMQSLGKKDSNAISVQFNENYDKFIEYTQKVLDAKYQETTRLSNALRHGKNFLTDYQEIVWNKIFLSLEKMKNGTSTKFSDSKEKQLEELNACYSDLEEIYEQVKIFKDHTEKYQKLDSKKIHDIFDKIGGNSELEDADLIFLGENHTDYRHSMQFIDLIRSFARSGDIVLFEGEEAGKKLTAQDDVIIRFSPSNLQFLGWDKEALLEHTKDTHKDLIRLSNEFQSSTSTRAAEAIHSQLEDSYNEFYRVGIEQRNHSLKETIEKLRNDFPHQKIFVILGDSHLKDQNAVNYLNSMNCSYIALKPKDQLSQEERKKRESKYY